MFFFNWNMGFSFVFFFIIFFSWARDVTRERTFQGVHTKKVQTSIKLGIILFILSEVIFFVSFFWAFFHRALNPAVELGNTWPPKGIQPLNPFHIPLLNSLILISSGVTVTSAHYYLMNERKRKSVSWTFYTIVLGIYFTILQAYEYVTRTFSITDSVYGSIFFLATGFHGLHVIIGTRIILFILIRLINNHFSRRRHLGYELACWYWHFVDLVWLFLFVCIYWWGW